MRSLRATDSRHALQATHLAQRCHLAIEGERDQAGAAVVVRDQVIQRAVTAFKDDLCATARDLEHSVAEHRFITFGLSAHERLLTVSHTERGSTVRIISARLMTRAERKIYEEG